MHCVPSTVKNDALYACSACLIHCEAYLKQYKCDGNNDANELSQMLCDAATFQDALNDHKEVFDCIALELVTGSHI